MKIISYNLRKNRAVSELFELGYQHQADVLCLQEADPGSLPDQLGHLKLVHATAKNRLGLAIYAHRDRFDVEESRTYELKKSMHDRILSPAHERLLGTRVTDEHTGRSLVLASLHAAPLTALNSLRRHQIHAALMGLDELGPGLPALMVGDYNYPVFQNRLIEEMNLNGYRTTISDTRTYTRYKLFRGHFDFATSIGFHIRSVTTLEQGTSDHMPILVQASPLPEAEQLGHVEEAELLSLV